MAALTDAEKVIVRRAAARKAREAGIPIRWGKAAINDSAQAIEDVLASAAVQTAINNAINAASGVYGITFTVQEKRWLAALVMEVKFTRDIIG